LLTSNPHKRDACTEFFFFYCSQALFGVLSYPFGILTVKLNNIQKCSAISLKDFFWLVQDIPTSPDNFNQNGR